MASSEFISVSKGGPSTAELGLTMNLYKSHINTYEIDEIVNETSDVTIAKQKSLGHCKDAHSTSNTELYSFSSEVLKTTLLIIVLI